MNGSSNYPITFLPTRDCHKKLYASWTDFDDWLADHGQLVWVGQDHPTPLPLESDPPRSSQPDCGHQHTNVFFELGFVMKNTNLNLLWTSEHCTHGIHSKNQPSAIFMVSCLISYSLDQSFVQQSMEGVASQQSFQPSHPPLKALLTPPTMTLFCIDGPNCPFYMENLKQTIQFRLTRIIVLGKISSLDSSFLLVPCIFLLTH